MDDDRIRSHDLPSEERGRILDRLGDALSGTEGIGAVYAFGSFVRGEPFRDLDLGILLEDPDDWRGIGRVAERVSSALGGVAFDVDVVPLNDASPAFRREIVREGVLLYESAEGEAQEFEVQSLSEYMDFQAFRRSHGWAS